jgi:hypothetical protein
VIAVLALPVSAGAARGPTLEAPPDQPGWTGVLSMPREDAIALALSPDHVEYRQGILSLVFRRWALEDPATAHARLLELADEADIGLIEIQVIEAWTLRDPVAALEAAETASDPNTLGMALGALARRAPAQALDLARSDSLTLSDADREMLLGAVAGYDPRIAAAEAASLGPAGAELAESFIYDLARLDPIEALDWLQQNHPRPGEFYDAIASIFFVHDPAAAFAYLSTMAPGADRRRFEGMLCRAREINEVTRRESTLPQPPPDYAEGFCER